MESRRHTTAAHEALRSCPTLRDLRDYVAGQIRDRAHDIAAHVETCRSCAVAVDAFAALAAARLREGV